MDRKYINIIIYILLGLALAELILIFQDDLSNRNGGFGVTYETYNFSIPPLETFCKDMNMTYFEGTLFDQSSCIDSNGEVHYYHIKVNENKTIWTIGDKEYPVEWRD